MASLAPRWRKVLRDLRSSPLRTVLATLAIAVGVFAVGVIMGSQVQLRRELNGGWASIGPADATLYVSGFDEELVARVRRIPGVAEAEGRRTERLRFRRPESGPPGVPGAQGVAHAAGASGGSGQDGGEASDGDSGGLAAADEDAVPASEWRDLRLTGITDFDDMRVSRIVPERGAWPPGRGEVLLERAALDYAGVDIGGRLEIEGANGRLREVDVVGVAHDRLRAEGSLEGSAAAYATLETMEWLGYGQDLDELGLAVEGASGDRDRIQAVSETVRERIERGGLRVAWTWIPEPGEHPLDDTIAPLFLILTVLGGLTLALSGLLVVNTVMALLAQQKRDIGVMKAIGARTRQLAAMYLVNVAAFGVLSLFVALPLGILGARAFGSWLAGLLNVDGPGLAMPAGVLAVQVAVALAVPLLAAAIPVRAGTRVTVRRALSDHGHGDRAVGSGRLDAALRRVPGLTRPQRLALRNAFRRRGRLAVTLATLSLAGAIFTAVFSVRASLINTLDNILLYWGHDVRVDFQRGVRAHQLERVARSMQGVELAEAWSFLAGRRLRSDGTESEDVLIVGAPHDSGLISPDVRAGRWLLPGDERAIVVNGELVQAEPDAIAVGDELTFRAAGRDLELTVVGILSNTRSGPRAYMNADALGRARGSPGRASSVRVAVRDGDPEAVESIGEALEGRFSEMGLPVARVETIAETRASTEYQFNILIGVLLVMAGLLALVGGMGLTSALSMNVLERTRELGVLRALGADDGAVLGVVLVEGLVVGWISAALGLLLALPLSRAFSSAVGMAFLEGPLDYRFSLGGAAGWLALATLLAAVASLIPAWSATRVSVREALAYE